MANKAKDPILHCLCGFRGNASECIGVSVRCKTCGWNDAEHARRVNRIRRGELVEDYYGRRYLKLKFEETLS